MDEIKRKCDCWLLRNEAGSCFCPLDNKHTRFSVRKDGQIRSRWETINEALEDGRKRVLPPFEIYDEPEQRKIISHE